MQISQVMSISHSRMSDMSELSPVVPVQQNVNGIAHRQLLIIVLSPIPVSLVQLTVVHQVKLSVRTLENVQPTVRPVAHLHLLNSRPTSTSPTSSVTLLIS